MKASDYTIVGGGVVGLSLARELSGRGASVTLFERRRIGEDSAGIASVAALGILIPPTRRLSPFGRLLRVSHMHYAAFCQELLAETGRDPGYDPRGGLHLYRDPPSERTRRRLPESYRQVGVEAEWIDGESLVCRLASAGGEFSCGLSLPSEAAVDPCALLDALVKSCHLRGVEINEGVGDVCVRRRDPVEVELADGSTARGGTVIVACGSWTSSTLAEGMPPVVPIRGQAVELDLDLGDMPILHFENATTDATYHILPKREARTWVGSTVEDVGFDVGTTSEGIDELRRVAAEAFPGWLGGGSPPRLLRAWSGLRPQAGRRGGPFIGPLSEPRDLWVASGHYRNGIACGPHSARLMALQLTGEELDPERDGFDAEEVRHFWP